MKKRIKIGVIVYILTGIIILYGYVAKTNTGWPNDPWGIRQWHQILGVWMFFGPIVGVMTATFPGIED